MSGNNEKGKAVLAQFAKLKEIRTPLDQEYKECYDYTKPSLGVGFQDTEVGITGAQNSKAKQAQLFTTTATEAVRMLSSSVLSSMTPSNNRWFDLAAPLFNSEELPQDAKEWLENAAAYIHTMIHASNYDSEAIEFMNHLMIAGMAGIYVEIKNGKYHFQTWPLNHLYCQETLNQGYIDTVYRQFQFTAQQAVVEFGLDKLPENIQDCYKNNENDPKKFIFVVAIRPRIAKGKQAAGSTQKNLPWESLWVAQCGSIVRESGFNEMPVIVPRWEKIPDTDYARGPVSGVLPDIKSLNKINENVLLNMDMHITGMFKIKDDGTINPNTIKFGARRVFPVNNMEDIQPLKAGGDINFATAQISSLEGSIRSGLLADQLGPTEKAISTATEVHTRNASVRQILGPIFARLQSELTTHLVTRCFGLAARANLLAPMPDSLIDALRSGTQELEIGYSSPLARAQKAQELQAVEDVTKRVLELAAVKPEVLDYMNLDKVVQKFGDLVGIDPGLMNDEGTVKKIRLQRQKQQEAAAAAQAQLAIQQAQAAQPVPEATM